MSLHATFKPTFIFNNENVQAYSAWLNKAGQLNGLSNAQKARKIQSGIQTLKKGVFSKLADVSFDDLVRPARSQEEYSFFYNPELLTGYHNFAGDRRMFAYYPQALQRTLATGNVSWDNSFFGSPNQMPFPFERLHCSELSLGLLKVVLTDKDYHTDTFLNECPKAVLEKTSPVIANSMDFNLFLSLNQAPSPAVSAYLKKVIIKDSFKKRYTHFQKEHAQIDFLDLRPYGVNTNPHQKITVSDPILTRKGLTIYDDLSKQQVADLDAHLKALGRKISVSNDAYNPIHYLVYSLIDHQLKQVNLSYRKTQEKAVLLGNDYNHIALGKMRDLVKKRVPWFGNDAGIRKNIEDRIVEKTAKAKDALQQTKVYQESLDVLNGYQDPKTQVATLANLPGFIKKFENRQDASDLFGHAAFIEQITRDAYLDQDFFFELSNSSEPMVKLLNSRVLLNDDGYAAQMLAYDDRAHQAGKVIDTSYLDYVKFSQDVLEALTDSNKVIVLSSLFYQQNPALFAFPEKGDPVLRWTDKTTWPTILQTAWEQDPSLTPNTEPSR